MTPKGIAAAAAANTTVARVRVPLCASVHRQVFQRLQQRFCKRERERVRLGIKKNRQQKTAVTAAATAMSNSTQMPLNSWSPLRFSAAAAAAKPDTVQQLCNICVCAKIAFSVALWMSKSLHKWCVRLSLSSLSQDLRGTGWWLYNGLTCCCTFEPSKCCWSQSATGISSSNSNNWGREARVNN